MTQSSTNFNNSQIIPQIRKRYQPLFPHTSTSDVFTPTFIYDNHIKRKQFLNKNKERFENMDTFYGINSQKFEIKWKASELQLDDILKTVSIKSMLHSGQYSEVYEGFHYSLNKKVAIKIFRKRKMKKQHIKRKVENEINLSLKLDHPNIAKTHEILEDKDNIYMVMDYLGKINLDELLNIEDFKTNKYLRDEISINVARDITSALNYLHCLKYFHGEINLENILYYKEKAYLVDFGLGGNSDDLGSRKMYRVCNEAQYRAPEMLKGEGYLPQTVDIWALGVVVYYLVSGRFPFGKSDESLEMRIMRFEPNLVNFYDEDLTFMIMRMLEKNFKKRPNSLQVSILLFIFIS